MGATDEKNSGRYPCCALQHGPSYDTVTFEVTEIPEFLDYFDMAEHT
jgi:hypothetical protein